MKLNFINVMLIILAIIGSALLVLSVMLYMSLHGSDMGDMFFRMNIMTFLSGILYIFFIYIIYNILKKGKQKKKK